ncbi:MAG: TRAP transporter small permease [Cyclobacteriaceae bacterium]|nr:TRAP transporter small permease [Cyclobacteriaceae bacterium]
MNRFFIVLYKISGAGAILSILGMITAVFVQVFARFMLENSPAWTEEMARIFFIYAVAFGAGLAVRNNDYVKLELIDRYLTLNRQKGLKAIIQLIIALFFLLMAFYAWEFIIIGLPENSPSLEVSMGLVFSSIFIAMVLVFVFTIEQLILLYKKPQP